MIIDKFTKWGYFIAYIKEISVKDIVQTYVKKVFLRYRVLTKIILDRDIRFILAFWQIFTAKQNIKIVVFIAYHPQTDG